MSATQAVAIRDKDVEHDSELEEVIETRCGALAQEFPEANHFEVQLAMQAGEVEVHAHVSGRSTRFASHARDNRPRAAGDGALEKLHRELRRHHDKLIFGMRREAQRTRANR